METHSGFVICVWHSHIKRLYLQYQSPHPTSIADCSSYCFISLSTDSVLLITLHKALPVLLWMQGPSFTEALSWIALVFIAHRCNENFDWKFTWELTCGLQLLKDFLCFHGLLGMWMRPGLVLVHPHHEGVPPQASQQVVFPIPLRGDPGLWHPCPLHCVRLSQSPSLLRPASGLLPHSDGPNFLHAPRLLLVTPMLSEIWCF